MLDCVSPWFGVLLRQVGSRMMNGETDMPASYACWVHFVQAHSSWFGALLASSGAVADNVGGPLCFRHPREPSRIASTYIPRSESSRLGGSDKMGVAEKSGSKVEP